MAGELGTLLAHPGFQLGEQGRAGPLARGFALIGVQAVDVALDVEQSVDAPDGLKRQRRDDRRRLALRLPLGDGGEVGQDEELAPRVRPARCLLDRPDASTRLIELAIAAIGVGLQDAAPRLQMPLGMLAGAVAGIEEQRRRRIEPAKRPVVAHIDPTSSGIGLALGQDGNRSVVAVETLGGEHMSLKPFEERRQYRRAGADPVGERRQAQRHAFPGVALGLPVERLMLAVLLEQDHGEKARAGEAARQHMERRRGLADLLACPAGELLPDVLQHLPLPWHHLQRLGDVLAELGEPGRPAAGAGGRAGNDDPLARQMLREGLARWLLARERANRGAFGRSPFGGELILRRGRFELLQFELHLIEKPRAPFAALAVNLAPHLLDGQTQMRDQSLGAGFARLRLNEVSPRRGEIGMDFCKLHSACQDQTLQRLDVVGQSPIGDDHGRRRTDSSPSVANLLRPESPCRTRSPGPLWMAPIDGLQQIAELRRRDRHDAGGRRRPDEPAPLEALGIERQAKPIVPKNFDQVTAASPEDVKITSMGVATKRFLDLQRQPVHAAAHVGHPRRQPHPDIRWNRDHRRSRTAITRARAAASTPASTMMRRPFATMISMRPIGEAPLSGRVSGMIIAGTKPGARSADPTRSARKARRHVYSKPGEIPCRRAVDDTSRGPLKLSPTIRSFSSSDQRRRRPVSTTSSR